ncbi:hypothetical protein P7C70_g769, partial [Phenoliferia sp. Uapishka_3]
MPRPSTRTLFYRPSARTVADAPDSQLRSFINKKHGLDLLDYWELHAWSIKELNLFWVSIWEFTGVIGERKEVLFDSSFPMDVPNPNLIRARLNFAENILLAHPNARSSKEALVSVIEPEGTPGSPAYLESTFLRSLSWEELYQVSYSNVVLTIVLIPLFQTKEVNAVSQTLKELGVGVGDRVVAFAPSNAEAIIACLATAVLGGIWSSCPSEFGTKAVLERFVQVLDTANYLPNQHHSLKSLTSLTTAGSVLKAELYDWVYENIGKDVFINNGSGGTDICNLFVGGVKSLPVYHAEIQVPGLGMAVESWDDDGKPIKDAQGNLVGVSLVFGATSVERFDTKVIVKPFPNMPLTFWGEGGDARYKAAYYEEYASPVWYQGDWIEISSLTGGVVIFGRSDGVLNPQGVRFGSSELYAVVEEMKQDVEDVICVGQKLGDGDERVVMFVKPTRKLTPEVVQRIKSGIRSTLSSRHVPAKIIAVDRIPYTTNGKRLEVATKKLVNGVKFESINLSSAEDPDVLRVFVNHPELVLIPKPKL